MTFKKFGLRLPRTSRGDQISGIPLSDMSQGSTRTTAQPLIHIAGNVDGQVAYGEFVYQVQAPGGTVTQIVVEKPIIPRPRPIDLRPSPISPPVGREDVLARISGSLSSKVQVHAADGWGKTSIIKQVARLPVAEQARDGVGYLSARGRRIEDIEQDLFEAFFDTALPQMRLQATPGQIRGAMKDVEALVLVDDLDLDRHDVERLLDDVPSCRVIITSARLALFDGTDIPLGGLDTPSAVRLLEERLDRDLSDYEQRVAEGYATSCQGQPLAIVLAAAAIRRETMEFEALIGGVEEVVAALGSSLNLAERRALGVLKAVRGAPLPADAVGAAGAIDQPERVLTGLREDGILQSASPRYFLPPELAAGLALLDMRTETLRGMIAWTRSLSEPQRMVEAASALVALAAWGQHHDPEATIALARAAHAGLFLGGAWAAWSDLVTSAGVSAPGPFDQAWVLHELGTRDLIVSDRKGASERLNQALDLRTKIGDEEGAEATRHNLKVLEGSPARVDDEPPDPDGFHWGPWFLATVTALIIGAAMYALGLFSPDDREDTSQPTGSGTVEPGTLMTASEILELGEIVVGTTTETPWSVNNAGPGTIDIQDVIVGLPFEAHQSCGTLEALQDCEITVSFAPDQAGRFEASLSVQHSGNASPLMITVVGSAVEQQLAFLEAAPGTLDFGLVPMGEVRDAAVALISSGEAPVDGVNPFLEVGESFLLTSGCLGRTLAPSEDCEVNVSFVETGPGVFEDTIIVEHSGGNDTLRIPVLAEVVAPSDLIGRVLRSGTASGIQGNDSFEYYAVPVAVLITNIGGEPVLSDLFRFHTETAEDGAWIPSGMAPSNLDSPTAEGGIGPGDATEMIIFVAFSTGSYDIGQSVPIRIVVDSCLGEEFIEDPPCRVVEANEDNNVSDSFVVTIDVIQDTTTTPTTEVPTTTQVVID